ncbi:polypeptide N-acetylgalactosaminyltransferase [Caerostris extrusa]|uniref:Polypeptide N-acetylgalactosaminyltransferase n=1 Tax=Caerostris extrusa TaxID=172846 RepID=A0AAV4P165_CAEEX|nr:polypeptide N-acetylgalactosaminyltransferase [Caerostris extrusa]
MGNYKRVAEVWMDEYKEFLYMRKPHYRVLEIGNLTEQKLLRQNLAAGHLNGSCKMFAFDQPQKYPPIEPPDYAKGEKREARRLLNERQSEDKSFFKRKLLSRGL